MCQIHVNQLTPKNPNQNTRAATSKSENFDSIHSTAQFLLDLEAKALQSTYGICSTISGDSVAPIASAWHSKLVVRASNWHTNSARTRSTCTIENVSTTSSIEREHNEALAIDR